MKIGSGDVASLYIGDNEASAAYIGSDLVWEKDSGYWGLCFTAEQANSTVKVSKYGPYAPSVSFQTSTDGTTWTPYTIGDTITLNDVGDKVYFAAGDGGNSRVSSSPNGYHFFVMTGRIAASGSIMSLLNKDTQLTSVGNYCFYNLFYSCSSLTTAPTLPATTLRSSCYGLMFGSCTSLTTAPELPATTLASSCYSNMFNNCTSLTTAPELPAETLVSSCYYGMF